MKILLKWIFKKPEREIVINVPKNLVDLGGYLKRAGISSDAHDTPDYANVISGEKKVPYFGLNWDGTRIVIVDKCKNMKEIDNQLIAANNTAHLFPFGRTTSHEPEEAVRNAVNYVLQNSQACPKSEK